MNRPIPLLSAILAVASATAAVADDEPTTVPITVSPVRSEALTPTFVTNGTVHSRRTARVTAGLEGRLAWVAEPGDYIAAGDPVARFDCEALELQREELATLVERERVRHRSLHAEVSRLEKAGLATSLNQLERTRADRDLAAVETRVGEVRVRQTDSRLERCTERAPFAGVVTEQQHRGGEDVARAQPLAMITDISNLEVRSAVPVRYLSRIATGSHVSLTLGEETLDGIVRTLVPAANAASQTFEVRIDLPPEASLVAAAGQLTTVAVPIDSAAAVTVPRDAIVLRSDGAYVMRIGSDNVAERVAVALSEASGDRVAVDGPLTAGDRVAVRGAEALEEGATVTVLSEG